MSPGPKSVLPISFDLDWVSFFSLGLAPKYLLSSQWLLWKGLPRALHLAMMN